MKYFFYTILLVTSLGTVAAIVNPPLAQRIAQQGATLIGLKLSLNSTEPTEEISCDEQLAKFLAQYPFADSQNGAITQATSVPAAVIPEPSSPPISHAYIAPVPEPPAPAYTQTWDDSTWDGAATTPVYTPPVVEDWSGPAQPYQEPPPSPHQSVYVATPQDEIFSVVHDVPRHDVPSFEPTKYVPQVQHAQKPPPPPSATYETPAALIENVYVPGTEMVARVGTQVILLGDILPKLRRAALRMINEGLKKMSEEERARITKHEIEMDINAISERYYPDVLQEQILFALVYGDYEFSHDKASRSMFDAKMGEEFDRTEIPDMMKEFNVENLVALKGFLKDQLGSSLEKEKRLWIREQIVKQWISMSVQRATGECTHDEMTDFYEKNLGMFTTKTQARWQEMVVLLSKHTTEQEAWDKIRWMGNYAAKGIPFEEIAKEDSDGFTASDGGVWDWTTKGNLASAELEQAIFTQPIGQLSPAIIRSDKGLHIIRVLERQEEKVVPFVEAQSIIREKIKMQRAQRYQDEYLAELRHRFPTIIVKDRIDFSARSPQTVSSR